MATQPPTPVGCRSVIDIAVVGAGPMARRRVRALLGTGNAHITGVAAAHLTSASAFATELGVEHYVDDYRRLSEDDPEAVLVEVPHAVQDEVVAWALGAGLHVLVGGPLSRTSTGGLAILRAARERRLVVEAGYEARYKRCWERARELIATGALGDVVVVRAIALWDAPPDSWYYRQSLSGGMPLTHMTYAFLNPLRWLLGEPTHVSALANRVRRRGPDDVTEETCVANLAFGDGPIGSLTAGYVRSGGEESWSVSIVGTEATLDLHPTEMNNGRLRLTTSLADVMEDFSTAPDAFALQAEAFLATLAGEDRCRNTPADTLGDLVLAETIVTSARDLRTVACPAPAVSAAPT
jgi:myo-inositol 2-dehydrogenase / D-chiro-inositol 1-dehydrogenase